MRSLLTNRVARLFVWFLLISVAIIWVMSRKQPNGTKQMQIGSVPLRVEVSQSQDEILLGLSYRDSLAEDHGMLFVMPYAKQQTFWMKGMRFSLDMIFIEGMRVVEIRANIPAPV